MTAKERDAKIDTLIVKVDELVAKLNDVMKSAEGQHELIQERAVGLFINWLTTLKGARDEDTKAS